MTGRVKGFTVILRDDIREDDFEHIENAVMLIKGVMGVEKHIHNANDVIISMRVENEFSEKRSLLNCAL